MSASITSRCATDSRTKQSLRLTDYVCEFLDMDAY